MSNFKEYPKMLYINNKNFIVNNKEEEDNILKGNKDESNKDNSEGLNKKINASSRGARSGRKSNGPRGE